MIIDNAEYERVNANKNDVSDILEAIKKHKTLNSTKGRLVVAPNK